MNNQTQHKRSRKSWMLDILLEMEICSFSFTSIVYSTMPLGLCFVELTYSGQKQQTIVYSDQWISGSVISQPYCIENWRITIKKYLLLLLEDVYYHLSVSLSVPVITPASQQFRVHNSVQWLVTHDSWLTIYDPVFASHKCYDKLSPSQNHGIMELWKKWFRLI